MPNTTMPGADQGPPRGGEAAERRARSPAPGGEAGFLRALLESATDYAIIATDLDGRVTLWNEGAKRVLGWDEAGMLGEPAHRIFTPEDRRAGVPEQEMATARQEGRAEDDRWHLRRDGSRFWGRGLMTPLRGEDDQPIGYLKILRDRTEAHEAEERRRLLTAELQHRVKNTLAMVQALANQTFRGVADERAREAFTARLVALGRAHDILTEASWTAAPLREVIEGALVAHGHGAGRFTLEGPDLELAAKPALALALALHELATNAAKYGALSVEGGRVAIRWSATDGRFRFAWAEQGGPPVAPPARRGFGSRLVERSLAAEFGGRTAITYEPSGVVCTIDAPLPAMREG